MGWCVNSVHSQPFTISISNKDIKLHSSKQRTDFHWCNIQFSNEQTSKITCNSVSLLFKVVDFAFAIQS